ncbi:hypothetical protein C0992_009714 [Termitomyces sp. T32_za158]|nr:hypothetical protein C0992_009714 [Termitomyces sp. T32_za158]
MAMTQNGSPFHWKPLHQQCFKMIKQICAKTLIICPIDPCLDEPIWLICNASKMGVGAMFGQGKTWQTCRPAGFMLCSRELVQQNYAVHELETLIILEALLKCEDKLTGYKIHIITDHKALEFFKTQVHDFVQADKRIDLEGEDLPLHRFQEIAEHHVEIRAMQAHRLCRSKQLKEQLEVQDLKAQGLARAEPAVIWPMEELLSIDDNPTVEQALGIADPSPRTTDCEDAYLHGHIRRGYLLDKFYVEIIDKPTEHPRFVIEQKLIYMMSPSGAKVKDQIDRMPMVEFAINASMSETTEYAPFELNSGYLPSMIKELHTDKVIH